MKNQKYDIAAYVWPSYSGNDPRTLIYWPEGMGEWQTVRDAKPKFPGHVEPRKPLWGYVNEANPDIMEMQINTAVRHGVNVFIYDWYWYDNRPFLENCLDEGFLGAPNNNLMQFYLMWANHDGGYLWDKRNSHDLNTVIWEGKADRRKFETICNRIIEKYFSRPNYYKINGKPVFSVFDIQNLVSGFGGIQETRDAFAQFDKLSSDAGYRGVHFQLTMWGDHATYLPDGTRMQDSALAPLLGFSSFTNYQFCQITDIKRDYGAILEDVKKVWDKFASYGITYIPHISVGWDNNARFYKYNDDIITGNTPEKIEEAFRAVKNFLDAHQEIPQLVTVNSWNEWTEGGYLQPDTIYGYKYLEAIRRVFTDRKPT
ncbi:MAG: glycoside hydrolase family 99-like domain-containing protein [Treponema sp.]|nr:glycoside hydrolase family 99-like domain-containing protein [Treponema sp.]